METAKKGILLVSFGTVYADTRAETIGEILRQVRERYPDIPVYESWTSGKIMQKVHESTGEKLFTVSDALEKMLADGIQETYVQPTFVTDGIENKQLQTVVNFYKDRFRQLETGSPLLWTSEDKLELVKLIREEYAALTSEEILILMGHGSRHGDNGIYEELNQVFQAETEKSIFLCAYEAKPGMEEVMAELKGRPVKRIHLAPFLLAAGYHARKDMAGPGKVSWRSICEEAGYEVVCHLKGLGEYPKVRERILFHLGEIIGFKNTR